MEQILLAEVFFIVYQELRTLRYTALTEKMYIGNIKNDYRKENYKGAKGIIHHYGDRKNHIEFRKLLTYISKKVGIVENGSKVWTVIFDFSCFKRKNIKDVMFSLAYKTNLYVFISADEIYDVCDPIVRSESGYIQEDDALRPTNESEVEKLVKKNKYGGRKLRCEEYLKNRAFAHKEGFPYIIIRPNDLFGPFDSSSRFWQAYIWIGCSQFMPI